MPSANELDAVTVDAMGTLVDLDHPVERLADALRARGHERSAEQVAAAFRREVAFYLEHKLDARDAESLAELRRQCARVFLEGSEADVDPASFSGDFLGAMVFTPVEGAVGAVERLRSAGLALACVSDWDIGLEEQLLFEEALSRLGVAPQRAVHVGDGEGDRTGAAAAGMWFEPVPLSTVPERLGLR